MDTVFLIVQNILTLLLIMATGYFLTKKGRITTDMRSQLSWILVNVVMPCMIVLSMPPTSSPEVLGLFVQVGAIMLATTGLTALGVHFLFRKQPKDTQAVMRYGTVYSNFAFMGIPILQSTFGDETVIYATITLAACQIITWTHGIALMDPRQKGFSPKRLLNSGMVSFFCGLAIMLLGIQLPGPITKSMTFISNMNTPLAMLIVGAQMASTDLSEIFREKRVFQVSALRLLVVPILAMVALYPLHLDRVMYCSLVILIGCPAGSATAVFAQAFGRDWKTAAQVVVQSTLLCQITLPLLVAMTQFMAKL